MRRAYYPCHDRSSTRPDVTAVLGPPVGMRPPLLGTSVPSPRRARLPGLRRSLGGRPPSRPWLFLAPASARPRVSAGRAPLRGERDPRTAPQVRRRCADHPAALGPAEIARPDVHFEASAQPLAMMRSRSISSSCEIARRTAMEPDVLETIDGGDSDARSGGCIQPRFSSENVLGRHDDPHSESVPELVLPPRRWAPSTSGRP